jgi:hypothetical protein
MKKGNYFGTEVDGRWWKRYRAPGFFARGNGEFSMDETGIHFLRTLTKQPLSIHWSEARSATLGKGHAGRWAMGRPVLKIAFSRESQELVAGFNLSSDRAEMEQLAGDINTKLTQS